MKKFFEKYWIAFLFAGLTITLITIYFIDLGYYTQTSFCRPSFPPACSYATIPENILEWGGLTLAAALVVWLVVFFLSWMFYKIKARK